MSVGADGIISVASNVIPKEVSKMVQAFAAGDLKAALKIHNRFFPLFRNLFIETNPGPVKAALALRGIIREEYRLPMVAMQSKTRGVLEETMRSCGILK